ncbi:MAG: 5-(carboxyamino)imidazole ribonucleotide mutase [Bacillota bacterium]
MPPKVLIIMGSDSDLPVMKKAADALEEFGVEYEMVISSAHRVPDKTAEYAKEAEERGIEVIIAGAGMAAHLPGVIASHTTLPVIGVPIASGPLNGVDALYAIVQMPSGIPVASMAVDGTKNAAIFAVQIIARKERDLALKLKKYKEDMARQVIEKNEQLSRIGVKEYLKQNK